MSVSLPDMAKLKDLLDPYLNHTSVLGIQYNENRGVIFASRKNSTKKYRNRFQLAEISRAVKCMHLFQTLDIFQRSNWQGVAMYYDKPKFFQGYYQTYSAKTMFIACGCKRLLIGEEPELNAPDEIPLPIIDTVTASGDSGHIDMSWSEPPFADILIEVLLEKLPTPGRSTRLENARLRLFFPADDLSGIIPDLAPGRYGIWYQSWQRSTGIFNRPNVWPPTKYMYWRFTYADVT
jgi:hypothetical protein